MAVCFLRIEAILDPEDLLKIQILLQLVLDLLFAHVGVTSLAEQTHFGGDQRTLTIDVDCAALKYEIIRVISSYTSSYNYQDLTYVGTHSLKKSILFIR